MSAPAEAQNVQASLSGLLDHAELLRVRIRPAEFARSMGVSKQSVSRWIRDGWIVLAADGRLDPVIAIGQLLRRCDPGRLRARWLRQAVSEVQELRDNLAHAEDRAEAAEAALRGAVSKIAFLEKWAADADRSLGIFRRLIVEEAELLRAAPPGEWPAILEELCDAADLEVNPLDDDDLADFFESTEAPRDLSTPEGGGVDAA